VVVVIDFHQPDVWIEQLKLVVHNDSAAFVLLLLALKGPSQDDDIILWSQQALIEAVFEAVYC